MRPVNDRIITLVAKQKISPKVIGIGKAGSAFLVTANTIRVKQSPQNIKKKQLGC